jgi:hypothetical protein
MGTRTAIPRKASAYAQSWIPNTRREQVGEITWSYSRRGLLEQCPRKYYYTYFGAAARKSLAEPEKATLRQLKALQNRHERGGALLHLAISTYFRRAQAGTPMTGEQLVDWVQSLFRRDMTYSASDPDGLKPLQGQYPPVLLREYHYRQADAASLVADAERRLMAAVRTFMNASAFDEFRRAGMQVGALVEQRLRLPGLPCKIDGRLDLAYQEAGRVTIVDWKMGERDGSGTESLQLAAYALWAVEHYQVGTDAVRVCKAYLGTEEVEDFPVTENILAMARARIIQDAERMSVLHPYGEQSIVDAFTPCAQQAICGLCPFQRVCPEGSVFLHA